MKKLSILRPVFSVLLSLMLMTLLVVGCEAAPAEEGVVLTEEEAAPAEEEAAPAEEEAAPAEEEAARPVSEFAAEQMEMWEEYTSTEIVTKGLEGEKPIWFDDILKLTDEEIEKVREANLRVAFAHVWYPLSMLVREYGMRKAVEELNMEIVAITDAELNPGKQKTDIETIMALNPDAIISYAADRNATEVFQPAVDEEVILSYLSSVPTGHTMGVEYAGMATDDCYDMGVKAAEIMAEAIAKEGKDGKIGFLYHGVEVWNTNTWDLGFKETIESMPNMEIIAEHGFIDSAEAEEVVSAWITQYPEINGVYASFEANAEYALSAIRAANRPDIKLTTCELSESLALDLARDGNVAGASIDTAYMQGYVLAYLVAWGYLGKVPESFVVVPAIAVTKENLVEMWYESYRYPLPPEVLQEYQ